MHIRFYIVLFLLLLLNLSFSQEKTDSLRNDIGKESSSLSLDTTSLLLEDDFEVIIPLIDSIRISVLIDRELVVDSVISDSIAIDSITVIQCKYDTLSLSDGARAVFLDSLYWMGVDSVFQVFDSMRVDPYGFDGAKFKDTLVMKLYDTVPDVNGLTRSWSMPLQRGHHVTSKFGNRHYKWHFGDDLRLSIGDSVTAVFDGVVRVAKYNYGGYGNYIIVRHHNGFETLYGHLSKRLVHVGDHVKSGDLIGWGGNTGRSSGPHLHFEVRFRGDALDPNILYDFVNDTIRYQTFELTTFHFEYIREMRRRIYHRVRSGDTLFGIAGRYHVSWRQIARLNRITTKTTLRIGQRLRIR
jgi:murein DD-endopeptidase MepM/ murein hydrolase activator NlpD